MTTKFLVTSLLGVSSLGGAIAGGVYLFKDNKPQKTQESPKLKNTGGQTETNRETAPAKPDAPEKVSPAKVTPAPAGTSSPGAKANTQLQQTAQRDGSPESEDPKLTK